MKTNKFYYAVWASNGLAVFNNWSNVEVSRKYFRGDQVKKYPSKEDAICAAINNYNSSHTYAKYKKSTLTLNNIEFTKNFTREGSDQNDK